MTMAEAKRLGWLVVANSKPELVDLGGGVFHTRPGKLAVEKTLTNAFGALYTRRIEVATSNLKDWPGQLRKQLLAEVQRVEELAARVPA